MKQYFKRIISAVLNKPMCSYSAEKEYVLSSSPMNSMKNKVALVTGGSGTLGRAICHHLAAEGVVVYVGGRNLEKITTVVDEINGCGGGTAYPCEIDVTDEISVSHKVEAIIKKENRIDILVNCAGGSSRGKSKALIDQDISVIDSVLSSNLRGTILCCKYCAPYMKQNKEGKILNIGSTTGIQGNVGNCDYTAAKSGVIGFTKALAQELGEYGVNVNCLSPGFIQTGTFSDERVEYLMRTNFLRKVGTPDDIAEGAVFLLSDKADFITGINLVIDGGRILGLHTFNA